MAVFALRRFNQTDKIYLSSTDDSEIIDGVKALETEGAWSFENLKIYSENEDILIIQNDLF